MNLNDIFDIKGNFLDKSYDPYRYHDRHEEMHKSLFDEDGGLNEKLWFDNGLVTFIQTYACGAFSDIVKLHWAQEMGMNTKGSYPAVYMWR
jgi:hypothetical protein